MSEISQEDNHNQNDDGSEGLQYTHQQDSNVITKAGRHQQSDTDAQTSPQPRLSSNKDLETLGTDKLVADGDFTGGEFEDGVELQKKDIHLADAAAPPGLQSVAHAPTSLRLHPAFNKDLGRAIEELIEEDEETQSSSSTYRILHRSQPSGCSGESPHSLGRPDYGEEDDQHDDYNPGEGQEEVGDSFIFLASSSSVAKSPTTSLRGDDIVEPHDEAFGESFLRFDGNSSNGRAEVDNTGSSSSNNNTSSTLTKKAPIQFHEKGDFVHFETPRHDFEATLSYDELLPYLDITYDNSSVDTETDVLYVGWKTIADRKSAALIGGDSVSTKLDALFDEHLPLEFAPAILKREVNREALKYVVYCAGCFRSYPDAPSEKPTTLKGRATLTLRIQRNDIYPGNQCIRIAGQFSTRPKGSKTCIHHKSLTNFGRVSGVRRVRFVNELLTRGLKPHHARNHFMESIQHDVNEKERVAIGNNRSVPTSNAARAISKEARALARTTTPILLGILEALVRTNKGIAVPAATSYTEAHQEGDANGVIGCDDEIARPNNTNPPPRHDGGFVRCIHIGGDESIRIDMWRPYGIRRYIAEAGSVNGVFFDVTGDTVKPIIGGLVRPSSSLWDDSKRINIFHGVMVLPNDGTRRGGSANPLTIAEVLLSKQNAESFRGFFQAFLNHISAAMGGTERYVDHPFPPVTIQTDCSMAIASAINSTFNGIASVDAYRRAVGEVVFGIKPENTLKAYIAWCTRHMVSNIARRFPPGEQKRKETSGPKVVLAISRNSLLRRTAMSLYYRLRDNRDLAHTIRLVGVLMVILQTKQLEWSSGTISRTHTSSAHEVNRTNPSIESVDSIPGYQLRWIPGAAGARSINHTLQQHNDDDCIDVVHHIVVTPGLNGLDEHTPVMEIGPAIKLADNREGNREWMIKVRLLIPRSPEINVKLDDKNQETVEAIYRRMTGLCAIAMENPFFFPTLAAYIQQWLFPNLVFFSSAVPALGRRSRLSTGTVESKFNIMKNVEGLKHKDLDLMIEERYRAVTAEHGLHGEGTLADRLNRPYRQSSTIEKTSQNNIIPEDIWDRRGRHMNGWSEAKKRNYFNFLRAYNWRNSSQNPSRGKNLSRAEVYAQLCDIHRHQNHRRVEDGTIFSRSTLDKVFNDRAPYFPSKNVNILIQWTQTNLQDCPSQFMRTVSEDVEAAGQRQSNIGNNNDASKTKGGRYSYQGYQPRSMKREDREDISDTEGEEHQQHLDDII